MRTKSHEHWCRYRRILNYVIFWPVIYLFTVRKISWQSKLLLDCIKMVIQIIPPICIISF